MREILFTGFYPCEDGTEKVFINGEWIKGKWVFGYFIIRNGKPCIWFETIDEFSQTGSWYEFVEVIPETVGQFTGLTDKNGTKIFEGDILDSGEFVGVVEYNPIIASFVVKIKDSTDKYYHWSHLNEDNVDRIMQLQYTEVIGNIHSNPELLEVK